MSFESITVSADVELLTWTPCITISVFKEAAESHDPKTLKNIYRIIKYFLDQCILTCANTSFTHIINGTKEISFCCELQELYRENVNRSEFRNHWVRNKI